MNTTQLGIMRSILADPDCDTPRLVFADACEEAGDVERAAWLRLQHTLANWKPVRGLDRSAPIGLFGEQERRFLNDRSHKRDKKKNERLFKVGQFKWFNLPTNFECSIHPYGSGHDARLRTSLTESHRARPLAYVRRGFVQKVCCDWSTWLANHSRLFWYAPLCPQCDNKPEKKARCQTCKGKGTTGQTVECDCGWGEFHADRVATTSPYPCDLCGTSGRIPRPCPDELAATAQPITRLELTDLPPALVEVNERHFSPVDEVDSMGSAGRMKWSRVKCPTCHDLSGPYESRPHCPQCDGTPSNSWTCDAWPGLEIVLPQTQYVDMQAMTVRAIAASMAVPLELLDNADYDAAIAAAERRAEREYHAR